MTMNCQEIRDQLHPFLDGELDPALAREIERGLDECPECQAELEELRALRLMARAALEGPVAEVDLSTLATGVMARLREEGALRGAEAAPEADTHDAPPHRVEDEGRSFVDWLVSLFRFEQPLVSAAALSFAALLVVIAATAFDASSGEQAQGPAIASPTEASSPDESVATSKSAMPPITPRKVLTLEESRHEAFVEHVEAAKGRVVVDDNADDPSKPMVVWHHLDEGAALPVEGDLPGQEL